MDDKLRWYDVDTIAKCDVRFRVCAKSREEAERMAVGKRIADADILDATIEICDVCRSGE